MKHRDNKSARRAAPATAHPTSWQNVADWYDQLVGDEGSDYHQHVILPGVLKMLRLEGLSPPDAHGPLRLLDLACGQGVFCRALAQHAQRHIKIIGVDAAPALVTAAQTRNEVDHLPISYHVADATKLAETAVLKSNSFDAITCILAVQNMTPLSPVWQSCHALLKPAGSL